ncbi:MAG: 10 kDa chaperonin [Candidatus Giovannonibacteria bacterium GW2011_GWC2_44_9]|uniref:Co-chaperonin GroES n=3 Tax=Candidatus Giovannoniibacteriota TaxID=1752738 RepID=A0A0G1LWX3_9BACT|nr:MAG: 10 kDa chaperonin [Candidatus Giovannonibacteria bacterium GW2011_GWB1_44_23]KKT64219.1 MAG: 10 kDa chaperonin [Candidatus Giovannonibacteria bacterium GW2011_GWA1_44_29]KKT84456.1 MAG: 10 kDa chaperonin [Candidatus Giovannonibacteria bacterium GW2011_GWC2_44_9]KKT91820.1 MAG: 10 kDa chaperonin [Parcubacteria group bacterium GW2011_GWC1_45_13]
MPTSLSEEFQIINYQFSIAMNIKPLGDRVLIESLSDEEKAKQSKGGILIPDTADKEKPQEGKVLAVGEGRRLENGSLTPLSVKAGDKVLFSKYGPTEIKIDDKEYLIAKEEDILAIIL